MPFDVGGNILTNLRTKLYNDTNIVRSGLILYLDAGIATSYPGTGTTWTDLSGNGYNGTLTNGPTFNSSNGGSIVFDGTNDYVIGNNTVNANTNITVDAWVFPTANPSGGGGGGFIVSNIGYYLEMKNTGVLRSYFYGVSSPGYHDGVAALSLNTWSYVTLVRNTSDNTIRHYINASLDKTVTGITGNTNNGAQNIQVGGYSGGSYSFQGKIAAARVYNVALSSAEITQNFNANRKRFGV